MLKREDVRDIAQLARLQVDDETLDQYVVELSDVLKLVAQMNQFDTNGVMPLAHPFDAVQRLRIDVVNDNSDRDKFQAIAPDVNGGLYCVPKVLE